VSETKCSESDLNVLLCFFDWKQRAIRLVIAKEKEWFYMMYGRYCNNARKGKWEATKILPFNHIET